MRNACQDTPAWLGSPMAEAAYQMLALVDPFQQIDAASELNNLAVTLIQSHRLREAIQALQGALDILCDIQCISLQENIIDACFPLDPFKTSSYMLPAHALFASVNQSLLMQCQLPSIQSCPVDSMSTVSVREGRDLTLSPHNYFSMYNRAFRFTDEQGGRSHGLVRRIRLLPAVILYNMGLVHHLLALQIVSSNQNREAMTYYEMALTAADDAQQKELPLYSCDYSLLVLALTNNLGFLSSHECNEQSSLYFAGRMLTTFATMDCSRLLIKEEYIFYYMNLLFVLNRFPVFAPAA